MPRAALASTLVPAVLVGLLLAGCSVAEHEASGEGEPTAVAADQSVVEQSIAEACALAEADITESSARMAEAGATIAEDPAGAQAALAEVATTMTDSADTLENLEVQSALRDAAAALDEGSTVMAETLADPAHADRQAVAEASAAIQGAFGYLSALCG